MCTGSTDVDKMTGTNRIGCGKLDVKTEPQMMDRLAQLNSGGCQMTSVFDGRGAGNSLTRRKATNVKDHADQNMTESEAELGSGRIR